MSRVGTSDQVGAAVIAGVVDRPRLFTILSSPLVRVCVLQGPSGAGKTTLLRSWVQQHRDVSTVAWVPLNEGITTRKAFWQHVVASAERLGEMPRETADEVRRQLSIAVDPVSIASAVLAAAGPLILVLDAYEHLGEVVADIDEDLKGLLAALPTLRIMVSSRARTALTELALDDGVVRVITLSDLALTDREIRQLLIEQAGIDDERLAQSVAGATRGFPLTVRAVALAIAQLGRIPRPGSGEWDRIAAAKLESLLPDPAAVQFVSDTSVPPYFDDDLAEQLSGNPDAHALLELLEHNGFGRWIPYARDRPVFQYVEAVRETFRARAAGDIERFRRSCTLTARWLLENDDVVDHALQFAVESGDYALADRVFVSLVISNPDSYITDRFVPTLRQVPERALHEYPMLAFGLGLGLMTSPVLRLEAPRAFKIARSSPATPSYLEASVDEFTHAGMRAVASRLARDYPTGATDAAAAARLVDAIDPAVLVEHGEHVGTILRQLSYAIWMGGDLPAAIAAANRSVALCSKPASRNYSTVYTAAMSAFAGDTLQASGLLASIDAGAWPLEMRSTSLNGLGLLAQAYVHLDAFEFDAAAETLHHSDPYMRTNEYWPLLTAAWVSTRHGLGYPAAEAQRVTAELAAIAPPPGTGDNVATQQLHAVLARAWIAAGDQRRAARLLERHTTDSPYLAAVRVQSALAAGRDQAALETAAAALELPGHTVRTRAETSVAAAIAALRRGDTDLAWVWLGAAGVAWETSGARAHLAFLDARDRRMLWEFARDRGAVALQRYLDIPVAAVRVSSSAELTAREEVVLSRLADHESVRGLAETLSVSPHTIKTQLQSIYRKLGVTSRQSALEAARELGLLRGVAGK